MTLAMPQGSLFSTRASSHGYRSTTLRQLLEPNDA